MPFILQPGLGFRPAAGVKPADHRRTLKLYLWQKSGGVCALCGRPIEPLDVHADHIIPRSRGGGDGVDNLQAAHATCNSRKCDRTNDEAIARIRSDVPYSRPHRTRPVVHREPLPPPVGYELPEHMTVAEVARVLRYRESLIRTCIRNGSLTATRITDTEDWIIQRDDFEAFIRKFSNV